MTPAVVLLLLVFLAAVFYERRQIDARRASNADTAVLGTGGDRTAEVEGDGDGDGD